MIHFLLPNVVDCHFSGLDTMFSFPTQNGVTSLFAATQSNHGGIVTLLLNASALVDLARNVGSLCFYQTPVTIINE